MTDDYKCIEPMQFILLFLQLEKGQPSLNLIHLILQILLRIYRPCPIVLLLVLFSRSQLELIGLVQWFHYSSCSPSPIQNIQAWSNGCITRLVLQVLFRTYRPGPMVSLLVLFSRSYLEHIGLVQWLHYSSCSPCPIQNIQARSNGLFLVLFSMSYLEHIGLVQWFHYSSCSPCLIQNIQAWSNDFITRLVLHVLFRTYRPGPKVVLLVLFSKSYLEHIGLVQWFHYCLVLQVLLRAYRPGSMVLLLILFSRSYLEHIGLVQLFHYSSCSPGPTQYIQAWFNGSITHLVLQVLLRTYRPGPIVSLLILFSRSYLEHIGLVQWFYYSSCSTDPTQNIQAWSNGFITHLVLQVLLRTHRPGSLLTLLNYKITFQHDTFHDFMQD